PPAVRHLSVVRPVLLFNHPQTTEIFALSLHDALPILHLSTPLIRLFLLVLILLLMPTLNFLPVWFALSLLRFRLPSRLPMMFILWMVGTEEDSKRTKQAKNLGSASKAISAPTEKIGRA